MISFDDIENVDFARVSFTIPNNDDEDTKDEEGTKDMSKKMDNPKSGNVPKDPETEEEEIIPGVTANMLKPFNKQDWTQEMKDEFKLFTSNKYADENTDETEDIKVSNDDKDTNLMSKEKEKRNIENIEEIWIGDTGASCHMANSMDGMINIKTINSKIIFGNGNQLKATHVGDKKGYVQ